jgi:Tol biopolymer transport system component
MKLYVAVVVILVCCCLGDGRTREEPQWESAVADVTVLQESGGRVSWLHNSSVIAFDKKGGDHYFDIYVVDLDGSGLHCLTCDQLMHHNGNPEWHPSGEYIVFQAQDPDLQGLPQSLGGIYAASPGVGIHNNIWVMTQDRSQFWQVTSVNHLHGALHPHFSPDGTRLVWSETVSPHSDRIGHWAIKVADFSCEYGEPRVMNV